MTNSIGTVAKTAPTGRVLTDLKNDVASASSLGTWRRPLSITIPGVCLSSERAQNGYRRLPTSSSNHEFNYIMYYICLDYHNTVEPLTNDHPHQRPSLSYDHISCDGQWFLFVYESLTSDHPSYTTTPI